MREPDRMTEGQRFVPLDAVERLERAQLEILALALCRDAMICAGAAPQAWGARHPAMRDRYRAQAHLIMQGLEPGEWRRT